MWVRVPRGAFEIVLFSSSAFGKYNTERFEMNVIKIILWMIAVFFAARGIYILAVTRGGSEWLPTVGLLMFARDALIAFSLTLIGFAIQYFSKFKLVRKESDNGQN